MSDKLEKPEKPWYERWRDEVREDLEEKPEAPPPRRWHQKVVSREVPFFSIVLMGYGVMTLTGFILLVLPISSADGSFTSPIDAMFTAASSISDTGLVVVNTGTHWSFFGQMVILALIQLGGLGFMVISSFLLLSLGKRVDLRDFRVEDAIGASSKGELVKTCLQALFITVVFEAGGAFILAMHAGPAVTQGPEWWSPVFHSISAFNNAGFDITANAQGFSVFQKDTFTLMVLSGLVFFGALSTPVIVELVTRQFRGGLSLDSKLAISTTLLLLAGGTIAFWLLEAGNNGPMSGIAGTDSAVNSFFISMSSRTAGFSPLDLSRMMQQSLFLIMILMFIGGVSGSTAGGIKVNTFAVMALTAFSYLRGRGKVCAFGRQIPELQVHKAVSVTALSLVAILTVTLALSFTEKISFLQLSFETVSAFSTVGFSTGITPDLSLWGKLILSLAMFVGRLGPLTVALALTREEPKPVHYVEEKVRVG